MGFIIDLLNQYGYIVLFFALALELLAFPMPGETLMTSCGFLTSQGRLDWAVSILIAWSGVVCGITTSYLIGSYLGAPFFEKHGSRVHLGPERIAKVSKWFDKYGNNLLIISFFIPGVRHVSGYFSGISKIPYKKFALHAYLGAFIYAITFISLGKVLGANWDIYHDSIKKYFLILSVGAGLVILTIYLFKNYQERIKIFINNTLTNSIKIFHSLFKIRMTLIGYSVALIALASLVNGIIQAFLANEFNQFNEIVNLTIQLTVTTRYSNAMHVLAALSSYQLLIVVWTFILIWIIVKGENKKLEISFFFILTIGSRLLEETLRQVFHQLNPISSSFPNEQSFWTIVLYGFATFVIYRHIRTKWAGVMAITLCSTICLFSAIGLIYLGLQNPSDILAGYVFGSFILCVTISMLEIYRIILGIKQD